MPNLTDVLLSELEDKPTVENLAMGVCIALYGENRLMTNTWLQFDMSTTTTGGLEWLAPNGDWELFASHDTSSFSFKFNGAYKFQIEEDSGLLSNRSTGLYWNNDRVLVSNPNVTGSSAITNIMELTQAEYDGITTPDDSTMYVVNG